MKENSLYGLLVLVVLAFSSPAHGSTTNVEIRTSVGSIFIAVDETHAPSTAANFLQYVDKHLFDGGSFYRTVTLSNQPNNSVKIEIIQGGPNQARSANLAPPIDLESTKESGISHKAGTISMARAGPNTAQAEFFICITDSPELDFGGKRNPDGLGFAAFGHVFRGMDVARRIQQSPATGQLISTPVEIVSIRRIRGSSH